MRGMVALASVMIVGCGGRTDLGDAPSLADADTQVATGTCCLVNGSVLCEPDVGISDPGNPVISRSPCRLGASCTAASAIMNQPGNWDLIGEGTCTNP
jgi:hypothetical protein